jgi:DNA-binding transcriptional MocR family regulator
MVRTKLHEQAKQGIERLIRERALTPGSKIPTESNLAGELYVSRTTIRNAWNLEQEGKNRMQPGGRENSPAAALVDLEVEFPRSQETEIIVPAKAVTEIQRLVREEGEVKLSICQNQIAFELNRTLLVSKLIEGNYPRCPRQAAEAGSRILPYSGL